MKIHTASFFTPTDWRGVTISIARRQPGSWNIPSYRPFMPPPKLLSDWRSRRCSQAEYEKRHRKVLSRLKTEKVLSDLRQLAGKKEDVTLLCWEREGEFCHRHGVMDWLRAQGVFEIGEEH